MPRGATPATTLAAFKSLKGLAPLQAQILEVVESFGVDGCIGDQVRQELLSRDMKDGSLNTRYSELERAGLIFRNGDVRESASSGRKQMVMRHSKFAGSVPAATGKARVNPFLKGMKHAARVVLKARDLDEAKRLLREELLKAATR